MEQTNEKHGELSTAAAIYAAQLARHNATIAAGLIHPPAHRMWETKKDEPLTGDDDAV